MKAPLSSSLPRVRFCYNAGTITAKTIQINGGTLYNAGTIGNPENPTSSITSEEELADNSLLVNGPNATIALQDVDSEELNIENAGYLKTSGNLVLNKSMKCDDGSYIECASLTLNGKSDGSCVLYLGNAACVNCLGNISIDNFGVWGRFWRRLYRQCHLQGEELHIVYDY